MAIAQAILISTTGEITTLDFQLILQSLSNKNSMVLAQKQTQGPIEQNRRSKSKHTQPEPSDF
jgi:hypothetical protein